MTHQLQSEPAYLASSNPYQSTARQHTNGGASQQLYSNLREYSNQQQGSGNTTQVINGGSQTSRFRRSRTPLPAPHSARREKLLQQQQRLMSKSAHFASGSGGAPVVAASGSQTSRFSSSLVASSPYAHLPAPASFDASLLPAPTVIVHSCVKNSFSKSNTERKHRGTSRNVLGGFYTS